MNGKAKNGKVSFENTGSAPVAPTKGLSVVPTAKAPPVAAATPETAPPP